VALGKILEQTAIAKVDRVWRSPAWTAGGLSVRFGRVTAVPHPVPLVEIQALARWAAREHVIVLFAGSPVAAPAPQGISNILRKSGNREFGFAGGITLVTNAAAFTAPRFITTTNSTRVGHQVNHFASVQRTNATDVTHESLYPAPGDHIRPGMTHQDGGHIFQHYWHVTREVSDLIRQGEQEHLDDARRAFELTYGLICTAINSLAGRSFGPAPTPYAAEQLAITALAAALPRQVGTQPALWPQLLDRLLQQTKTRDTQGWHSVATDPPVTQGNKVLHPISTTSTTSIGRIPSSQVVNY
jgi:hypothetical protein